MANFIRVTANLWVYPGSVNTGVLLHGDEAILIDPGDGEAIDALSALTPDTPARAAITISRVLFTHHHRDVAWSAHRLACLGAAVIAPELERRWFDDVASYWNSGSSRWHLFDIHPHHRMLGESVDVSGTISGGDSFEWGAMRVTAVATPGHTDGSLSYIIEDVGRTFAFTGDLVYDGGRLWELYSMQRRFALPGWTDYHGFLGTKDDVISGLRKVIDFSPDTLIPSHGPLIANPGLALNLLEGQMDECYRQYIATSALRHYLPEHFSRFAEDPLAMAPAPCTTPPPWTQHIGTSWLLHSESGAVFVMDCGDDGLVKELQRMLADGEATSVDGLWITHYHSDHVDGIPAFQAAFDCPLIAVDAVADVISSPMDWWLPCISPCVARVDKKPAHGESWVWRGFLLTAYTLPGQTLHHGGLLVEGCGRRLFFSGDSFTPLGMDDYCAGNRNFLGKGKGFDQCLALLQELAPDTIFNAHVDEGFSFTEHQLSYMLDSLATRERSFGALLPWPHPNFGMDEDWAYCYPYEQVAQAGDPLAIDLAVTNHADTPQKVSSRLVFPRAWSGGAMANVTTERVTTTLPPKAFQTMRMAFTVPAGAPPGRHIVMADVWLGDRELPQHAEAVVVVAG